ncbi:hypothetical protein [Rhizobium sp. RCAM05973]|uniref:hypothetical protein n=1 Tax=Rhizobium sp. RCAM05973 TaxID=2994066 RepID=UPI0022EBA4D2|nr:hypothetical protein [Rhizobium sp. RCAM05973]
MDLSLDQNTAKVGGAIVMLQSIIRELLVRSEDADAILETVAGLPGPLRHRADVETNQAAAEIINLVAQGAEEVLSTLTESLSRSRS